uniref:Uncharacterized protein n=1 Tax=Glossina palpalis gambiensis TaxID=67801 RepID=A0A1B0ARZ4_9MUSC
MYRNGSKNWPSYQCWCHLVKEDKMQTRTVTTEKKKNMQTTTKYTNARRKKQTSNCVNTALQITTCTCHVFDSFILVILFFWAQDK